MGPLGLREFGFFIGGWAAWNYSRQDSRQNGCIPGVFSRTTGFGNQRSATGSGGVLRSAPSLRKKIFITNLFCASKISSVTSPASDVRKVIEHCAVWGVLGSGFFGRNGRPGERVIVDTHRRLRGDKANAAFACSASTA